MEDLKRLLADTASAFDAKMAEAINDDALEVSDQWLRSAASRLLSARKAFQAAFDAALPGLVPGHLIERTGDGFWLFMRWMITEAARSDATPLDPAWPNPGPEWAEDDEGDMQPPGWFCLLSLPSLPAHLEDVLRAADDVFLEHEADALDTLCDALRRL